MQQNFKQEELTLFKVTLPLLLICITVVPFICAPIYLLATKILNTRELAIAIVHPFTIFCHVLLFVVPIVFFFYLKSKINAYDGTDSSITKLNRIIKSSRFIITIYNTILSVLTATAIGLSLRGNDVVLSGFGDRSPYLIIIMIYYGFELIFAIMFMSIFNTKLEHFMYWLPFDNHCVTASNRERIILFSVIIVIGYLFILGSTFYVEKVRSTLHATMSAIFISGCAGFISLIVTNFVNALDIAHNLQQEKNLFASIIKHDYTLPPLQIMTRNDFGILNNDINNMYDEVKKIFKSINDNVLNTSSVSTELANYVDQTIDDLQAMRAVADSVKDEMENQVASVEETSATAEEIIKHIRKLNEEIESQTSAITQSSAAIEEMVANVNGVTRSLKNNSETVSQLEKSSEIGMKNIQSASELAKDVLQKSTTLLEASKLIQNIAEQTNLLSMNAAIEAAHAGDAGKGFSVVADEIRKLSEQSASSAQSIEKDLKSLSDLIDQVAKSTETVAEQFGSIYNLSQKVKNEELVISNAMSEQEEGSKQILDGVSLLTSSTYTVKTGSAEMLAGGEQIATEMKNLNAVTVSTNDKVNSIDDSINKISDSIKLSKEHVEENNTSVEKLGMQMSTFKL